MNNSEYTTITDSTPLNQFAHYSQKCKAEVKKKHGVAEI